MVFYFPSGVCSPGTNVITSAFIWPHKNKWMMPVSSQDRETDAWEFWLYYNILMKGPKWDNCVARRDILSIVFWVKRGGFTTARISHEQPGQTWAMSAPASSLGLFQRSMTGSIIAVCLQTRQAQAAVWYWNNFRWYQLTSARRLTTLVLRPSRWFDMLYSSAQLDRAVDAQFPLLDPTWGSFPHCRHANWADLPSLFVMLSYL